MPADPACGACPLARLCPAYGEGPDRPDEGGQAGPHRGPRVSRGRVRGGLVVVASLACSPCWPAACADDAATRSSTYSYDPGDSAIDVDTPAAARPEGRAPASSRLPDGRRRRRGCRRRSCPTITLPCLGGGRDVDLAGLPAADRAELLGAVRAGRAGTRHRCSRQLHEHRRQAAGARRRLHDPSPARRSRSPTSSGSTYPQLADPDGSHAGAAADPGPADDVLRRRGRRGRPTWSTARSSRPTTSPDWSATISSVDVELGVTPAVRSAPDDRAVPGWLAPVVDAASTVPSGTELSRLAAARRRLRPRAASVLILFGDDAARTSPTCCCSSAPTTCARTPARSRSPAAAQDADRRRRGRGGAARGRGGDRARPAGVDVIGVLPDALAAADQLRGHARSRLVAYAVRGVAPSTRPRPPSVHTVPVADLARPDQPGHGPAPVGLRRTGVPRARPGRVGVHGRAARRGCSRWSGGSGRGTSQRVVDLPDAWSRARCATSSVRSRRARSAVRPSRRRDAGAPVMNALDCVLLICVVIYALSGYQQGFLVGSASTVRAAGRRLHRRPGHAAAARRVRPGAVGLDRGPADRAGLRLPRPGARGVRRQAAARTRVTWRPARVSTRSSGAALSVVAMLLIAWVLGVAASGAHLRGAQPGGPHVVGARRVDNALPGGSDRVLSAFNSLVDSSRFPRYLEPFAPERIKRVPAPTSRGRQPARRRAGACQRGQDPRVRRRLRAQPRGQRLRLSRPAG